MYAFMCSYLGKRLSYFVKPLSHETSVLRSFLRKMSDQTNKKVKIGTHNGVFHCDEVLACVLLRLLPQYTNATIIRSRNQDILDECDIVVDVGGVYNPSIHRYDHHMRDFCQTASTVLKKPNYNNNIKLSSAGLIYCHFGHEVLKNLLPCITEDRIIEEIFRKIYDSLIVEIDAIDNGVKMCESKSLYNICTDLSSQVKHLNPSWNNKTMNEEEQFNKAIDLVKSVFLGFVTNAEKVWLPAKEVVRSAVNNRYEVDASGEIIELSQPAPWQEHLLLLEYEMKLSPLIKYVIFSSKGDHRVQCVPISLGNFQCRMHLPEEWGGLRNDVLVAVCGIEGAVFVHASAFIGGHKTRDGALAMAQKALKIGKDRG